MNYDPMDLERAARRLGVSAHRPERQWRPVGISGSYAVSDDGLVLSFRCSTPRFLKPSLDASGRITFAIFGRPVTAASLLREAFDISVDPRTMKPFPEPIRLAQEQLAALRASSSPLAAP